MYVRNATTRFCLAVRIQSWILGVRPRSAV
jgi:hypothetical protein